jgi:hypothetical protein
MQIRDLSRLAAFAVTVCGGLACGGAGCGGSRGATHPEDSGSGASDSGGSSGDSGADDAAVDDGGQPPPIDAGPATGPLRVDARNRRYFADGSGRPVYLTGSHTWGSFKDRAHTDPPPAFSYAGFLDFLVAHHHNFVRLWTWEQPHSFDDDPQNLLYFAPFPWLRTGPGMANDGKPRFDLDRFDPAYFARLRARVIAARDRGIYVAVMLFDGWDLTNGYNPTDGGFPFGAGNNINNVAITGAAAFALGDAAITARQEAYVRAVIDAVNDLDNVLYEIANETDASAVAWQYHMIDFVKSVEQARPEQHPVGMTSTYPGNDTDLFNSRADWISPNGPMVASDGTKVILNDTDHSYGWSQLKADGPAAQRAWAWKTLCLGSAPLFMDPYLEPWAGRNNPTGGRPDPAWDTIRAALGRTRRYAERLDLSRAVPSPALCSTGFCLADPGREYLVYKPPGAGGFKVTTVAGTYRFEWFNPATGAVGDTGTITVGADHTFTPPFTGDAVLLLQL